MNIELTKPADVAALFIDACKQLRELGATRVEGFGMVACFHLPQQQPVATEPRERREERRPQLSQEEQEMQARLGEIVRSGRAA